MPITVSTGEDAWTRQVRNELRPRVEAALRELGEQLAAEGLPRSPAPVPLHLRTHTETTTPAGSRVVDLRSNTSLSGLFERGLFLPLRKQVDESGRALAGPRYDTLPAWLREGSAVMISEAFIRTQEPKGLRMLSLDAGRDGAVRAPDAPHDAAAFLAAPAAGESRQRLLGHAWLVEQLSAEDRPRFARNWACLLRSTAIGRPYAEGFGLCFHETPSAFEARIDAAIMQTRARRYEHDSPVPPASGFAALDDVAALPFRRDESSIKGWQSFLKHPAPRAFSFGPNGAWASVYDQADAMARALELCRRSDPDHCRLYAVDDQVVFRPETAIISVQLAGKTTSSELGNWKARVEKTSGVFLHAITEASGTPLAYPATIHLTENQAEFEQSLTDTLGIEGDTLEHYGTHASGVANGHGRIVIRLPDVEDTQLRAQLVDEISLHELAHEWQGQLGHDRQGFAPPAWLIEGGAEYIAWVIGPQLEGEAGQRFDPVERMHYLRDLYRLAGLPTPAEIFQANRSAWREMAGGKTEHYPAAELMTRYLAQRLSTDFMRAYADYFRRSGISGETADSAFKACFGMTPDEFLGDYSLWLTTL